MPKNLSLSPSIYVGVAIAAIISFPLFLTQQGDPSLRLALADLLLLGLFGFLARRKHPDLALGGSWQASLVGAFLIAVTLGKMASLYWFEPEFAAMGRWLVCMGLALILLGFRGFRRYWRELLLLGLLTAPMLPILAWFLKIEFPTAAIATFGLHYLGVEVIGNGSIMTTPGGSVNVNLGCTALDLLLQTYKLLFLLFLAFPLKWLQRLKLWLIATLVPFFASVLRVMLLAMIVGDRPAFTYWHTGGGGNWFALGSLLLCGWGWIVVLGQTKFEDLAVDGARVSKIMLSKSQQILLGLLSIISLGLFGYSLVNPAIGRRDFTPHSLPASVPNSTKTLEIAPIFANPPNFRAGKVATSQSYEFNFQDRPVTMEVRYLVGTRGNLEEFFKEALGATESNSIWRSRREIPAANGTYDLAQTQRYLHFSTCLYADGSIRPSPLPLSALVRNQERLIQQLGAWLAGSAPLRDHRCLWFHAFTPIDPDARTRLLEFWQQQYPYWRSHFPIL